MVDRLATYNGIALLSPEMENYNFKITNMDDLVYIPSTSGGVAQLKIDSEGGTAPLWKNLHYTVKTQQSGGYYKNLLPSAESQGTSAWKTLNSTSYKNQAPYNVANGGEALSDTTAIPQADLSTTTTSTTCTAHVGVAKRGTKSIRMVSKAATGGDNRAGITGDVGALRSGFLPGHTYTITAWHYIGADTPAVPDHTRGNRIAVFYSTDGSTYATPFLSNQNTTRDAAWHKLTVTFTLPANTVYAFASLYCGYAAAGYYTYWDEIQITESTTELPWIDGMTTTPNSVVMSTGVTSPIGQSSKATPSGIKNYEGQQISVPIGQNIECSARVQTYAPTGSTYTVKAVTNTGQVIGSQNITSTGTVVESLLNGYTDDSCSTLKLQVYNNTASGTTYQTTPVYATHAMVNTGPVIDWIAGDIINNYGITADPFQLTTELYGVTESGTLEFIGEQIDTDIDISQTTDTYMFDLIGSACRSKFIATSLPGTTGKISLNLPKRAAYYDHFKLHTVTYTGGWTRYKKIPITGKSNDTADGEPMALVVAYDTDMQIDFSDVILLDSNGNVLDYAVYNKTDSTSATFIVKLNHSPKSNVTEYIYMWYKSDERYTPIALSDIYPMWDDFEDGLLTGRTGDYINWTVQSAGTFTNITSDSAYKLYGSYSLRSVLSSGTTPTAVTFSDNSVSSTMEFSVKVTTASGTTAPGITHYIRFVDMSNWLAVRFYRSGSYQYVALIKNVGGTQTVIRTEKIAGTYWASGTVKNIRVTDTGRVVEVYIGGVLALSYKYSLSMERSKKGFGVYNITTDVSFDNVRLYQYVHIPTAAGTAGAETTGQYMGTRVPDAGIVPDTYNPLDQTIKWTTPSTVPVDGFVEYQEIDKEQLNGDVIKLKDAQQIVQGYNGLDGYKSLILKWTVQGQYYDVTVDKVVASYEI